MSDYWSNNVLILRDDLIKYGVANFRSFGVIKDNIICSYYNVAKDYLDGDTESLIRKNVSCETDFYQLCNQVMHLKNFLSLEHVEIDKLHTIFEFGGGCGYMRHILKLLGFCGIYQLYDFQV